MHSRLNLVASRCGRGTAPRRPRDHYDMSVLSQRFHGCRRALFGANQERRVETPLLASSRIQPFGHNLPKPPMQAQTFRMQHSQASRRFHRAKDRLAPPASSVTYSVDVDEEYNMKNLDEDIERLALSSLSHVLPEEIFYKHDDRSIDRSYSNENSALAEELGVDSEWDGLGDDKEFDDVQEEQYHQESQFGFPKMHDQGYNTALAKADQTLSAIDMLKEFDSLDRPSPDNREAYQLWLECAAQYEAAVKYQKVIESARSRRDYDSMGILQSHIVQWYQEMRDAIDTRQKEYLSDQDKKKGKERYGPLLCSVSPDKLAVIVAHEATTTALLNPENSVLLVDMAETIGRAVETEVLSQRRIRARFGPYVNNDQDGSDDNKDANNDSGYADGNNDNDMKHTLGFDDGIDGNDNNDMRHALLDRWDFSASHLSRFMEELKHFDPKFKKNKRSIERTVRMSMRAAESWNDDDIIHLGVALLSILLECASVESDGRKQPAFSVEKKWTANYKTKSIVCLNREIAKRFLKDDFLSLAATTTRHTPMVVTPSQWVSPDNGGYRWLKVDIMRCKGSDTVKEALHSCDLNQVFDGLNVLGRTPWRINRTILDVAQRCWEKNLPCGDIPSQDDFVVPPEPAKPERIAPELFADKECPEYRAAMAANKAYREASIRRARIHQKNMDLRSLRSSAVLKLDQADKFKEFDRIYFPYNVDFRGRAYPIPPHLSNVGSDLCRGMLTFADAKPLGKRGLFWLKVHLANFAGQDKMSFDDRAQFIDENIDNVRRSVDEPFGDNPWWKTLDDPFQGLATCHEIIRAIDSGDPESYMCSLPVHMDGSCNGLQHYAALGRDTVGGKAVNLLEGDGPQDVYVGVMHEVIRRVAEEAERELDFDVTKIDALSRKQKIMLQNNRAAKLVNGLIDRGVVKRTVMTSVYGVTYVGARKQIQEKVEEKLAEKGYDLDEMNRQIFGAAGYLATLTIEVMGDLFQGARKTKSWLTECARLISQQGHPVAWVSPIGIPAIQPYRQKRSRLIITALQSVTITRYSDELPVHKSRQVTAFSPNYVHSLDSSHMILTALEMDRRGLCFSAVHDSFWTHACDVDELNSALRDCFVELYSKPLLSDLKKSWELRYPEIEFPELPELGDLDLNEVKSATYFFQ